jgi:hypothetical protein
VFGGDNIPDHFNSDPAAAVAFRKKLGDEFIAVVNAPQSEWKDVVPIAA